MELAPLEDGVGMELVFAGGLRDCLPGFDLTDDLELELLGELTPLEGHGWFSFGKGTTLTACLIYGVQSTKYSATTDSITTLGLKNVAHEPPLVSESVCA